MSYIRATEEGEWEPIDPGHYTYSDGENVCYMPRHHRPFIEVVMRMLDQSGELDDEMLRVVHGALHERLGVDGEVGRREV